MSLRGANPAQVANSLIAFLMNDSVGKVIAVRKRWFHRCHRWSLQWLVNSPLYLMCQWNCACCLYGCPPQAHLRHMPIKFLVCCISLRNITHVVLKLFKFSSSLVINWHHLVVDVPGDGDGNPEPKAPILGVELQQRHSWGGGVWVMLHESKANSNLALFNLELMCQRFSTLLEAKFNYDFVSCIITKYGLMPFA